MKNTKPVTLLVVMVVSSLLFLVSCTSDVAESCGVTYDAQVKNIMTNTCAYAGCHSGSTASPYVPASVKDFTNYEGLMACIENGSFRVRVLESLTMPPSTFIPAGKPTSLTEAEIETLSCWLESGHPER